MIKIRIGIVGFGKLGIFHCKTFCFFRNLFSPTTNLSIELGQYLYRLLQGHPEFEIAFVWNRTKHVLIDCNVAPSLVLDKLENIFELEVDLIVEVAHPDITHKVLYSHFPFNI